MKIVINNLTKLELKEFLITKLIRLSHRYYCIQINNKSKVILSYEMY